VSVKAIVRNRQIKTVFLYDTDKARAEKVSRELSTLFKDIYFVYADDVKSAIKKSDIVVTCTTSRTPIIDLEDVSPGTFIAAVGCDSEEKSEIHPRLISACKLVSDFTEQAAAFGDLHHAIQMGMVTRSHVHAELGEVIAGQKSGRDSDEEIIIFDSTGTALQDVAAASIVYEKAHARSLGRKYNFQN
jgi:alanine dehydrogenase